MNNFEQRRDLVSEPCKAEAAAAKAVKAVEEANRAAKAAEAESAKAKEALEEVQKIIENENTIKAAEASAEAASESAEQAAEAAKESAEAARESAEAAEEAEAAEAASRAEAASQRAAEAAEAAKEAATKAAEAGEAAEAEEASRRAAEAAKEARRAESEAIASAYSEYVGGASCPKVIKDMKRLTREGKKLKENMRTLDELLDQIDTLNEKKVGGGIEEENNSQKDTFTDKNILTDFIDKIENFKNQYKNVEGNINSIQKEFNKETGKQEKDTSAEKAAQATKAEEAATGEATGEAEKAEKAAAAEKAKKQNDNYIKLNGKEISKNEAENISSYIENNILKNDEVKNLVSNFKDTIKSKQKDDIAQISMLLLKHNNIYERKFPDDYEKIVQNYSTKMSELENQFNKLYKEGKSTRDGIQLQLARLEKADDREVQIARFNKQPKKGRSGHEYSGGNGTNNEESKNNDDLINEMKKKLTKFKKSISKGSSSKIGNNDINVFSQIYNKYNEDKDEGDYELKAEKEFVRDFELSRLDKSKEGALNNNDKFIFIVLLLLIRLLSMSIVNYLLDGLYITSLISALVVYVIIYIVIFISIVALVNMSEGYKLRVLLGAFDLNGNFSGVFTHMIVFFIFSLMIYNLYLNLNVNQNDDNSEESHIKISYKLELITGIILIFSIFAMISIS